MANRATPGASVSAVLIGCGNIGSLFDEHRPGRALTHAGALQQAGIELLAVCDADIGRARSCAAARGVEATFTDYRELFAAVSADVACIATPTQLGRCDIVASALEAGFRGIFCEKPIETTLERAERLRALVPPDAVFAVNYMRSWSRGLDAALDWMREWPRVDHVVVRYDKGFANNGSHAIDLLRHFVGWPREVEVIGVIDDGLRHDPTVEIRCRFEGGASGTFLASDFRHYSRFDVELTSERGRVSFLDKGRSVVFDEVAADAEYRDYQVLVESARVECALEDSITRALRSVVVGLNSGLAGVRCTLDDAITTMGVVDAVREKVK